MLKFYDRPRRTALMGALAALVLMQAPAVAKPGLALESEVTTARVRLLSEMPMPVTPASLEGIYQVRENGPSAQALMTAAKLTVEENTIAAHIKNIRDAFKAIEPTFSAIKTERGVGYRWLEEE